jgi:hypothetical protein
MGDSTRTVGDLLDYLAGQPRDRLIVMSKDGEGNSHSPLSDACEAMYVPESTWSGDTYPTPEEIAASPHLGEDDEAPEDAVRVVLLGPVN